MAVEGIGTRALEQLDARGRQEAERAPGIERAPVGKVAALTSS